MSLGVHGAGAVEVHGVDGHEGDGHDHALAAVDDSSGLVSRSSEGHEHGHHHDDGEGVGEAAIDWLTGEGVTFGGVLFPSLHVAAAFGGSTADSIAGLASGHHDPQSEATLQSIEPGLALEAGDHLRGFGNYSAFTDADEELDGKWEEAWLGLAGLAGGFELRGGRFLNRFGFQNALHNHAWGFVNQNLSNGRLLQEGELTTIGAEATWRLPTTGFRSSLSASFGVVPEHDHAHTHHDHGDEGEAGEAAFDAEGARFDDQVAGVHFEAVFDRDRGRVHRLTASAAWGENAFGRTSQVYGIGHEFEWRPVVDDSRGRFLRWRSELVYRDVGAVAGGSHGDHDDHDAAHDAHDDDHDDGHADESGEGSRRDRFDEFGLYSALQWGVTDRVVVGLRAGWIGGIDAMGLDERVRASPSVTVLLNAAGSAFLRLQYDHDHSPDFGTEHSGWAQFGFSWGGGSHDHAH